MRNQDLELIATLDVVINLVATTLGITEYIHPLIQAIGPYLVSLYIKHNQHTNPSLLQENKSNSRLQNKLYFH